MRKKFWLYVVGIINNRKINKRAIYMYIYIYINKTRYLQICNSNANNFLLVYLILITWLRIFRTLFFK
jgi:hypothetical protein